MALYPRTIKECQQLIKSGAHWILDTFIAPPFCAYCKVFLDERQIFCRACFERIAPLVSNDVQISSSQKISVFAVSEYQEPLKSLIVAKSWSDRVASQQLARLMWDMTYMRYQPCDILVPVPLHWTRKIRRGFNQAEVIADELAGYKGCRVINAVQRCKRTPFQSALPVIDRPDNVKDAFAATKNASEITGKHVMIVDDLMTTGATIRAVAKSLLPYKPASLAAIVACRVL